MKLIKTIALGTVLGFGLQHGAAAGETALQDQAYAGMEEMVVVAKRLPAEPEMEEMLVVATRLPAAEAEMEEIVVVAKRIRPATVALQFRTVAFAGDFSGMAGNTPSL